MSTYFRRGAKTARKQKLERERLMATFAKRERAVRDNIRFIVGAVSAWAAFCAIVAWMVS